MSRSIVAQDNIEIRSFSSNEPTGWAATLISGLSSPQMGALVALSAALTLGVGLILWSMQPTYAPLFDRMDPEQGVDVMAQLRSQQVPFQIEPSSGTIMVPADQVQSLRLRLAGSGISGGERKGVELLSEESSLGTSQFIETTRYQHALEVELSRTISEMRNIKSARVHLAQPKQSVFIRQREKASASVMVKLASGRTLDTGQVNAIVNLVASSIAYLSSGEVTVIDQWGQLLSGGAEGSNANEMQHQFKYTRSIETLYSRRIESLLSPLVGKGAVRATVSASIDFTSNEQTQELFDGENAKIRSEQTQEQLSQGAAAIMGIPGALSNQPPEAGTTDADTETANGPKGNSNRQSTRNYELDKTIVHQRRVPGTIEKLSAAVIIDDHKTVDEAGEVVRTPLSEEELERLRSLVREVIGFNEARGDSVIILNQTFQPQPVIEELEPLPLWEQPQIWGMGKQLLTGIAVLLLILMVVRPAMRQLKGNADSKAALIEQRQSEELSASIDGEQSASSGGTTAALDGPGGSDTEAPAHLYGDILNMARLMADEDPKRVAKMVKDWVGDGQDGK